MTQNTSDRVQVLDFLNALPGKCAMCGYPGGQGDGRKFVDIGFDLDFYGQVVFCSHCMGQIAERLGYVPQERVQHLYDDLEKSVNQIQLMGAENAKLRHGLSSLDFLPRHIDTSNEGTAKESRDPRQVNSKSSKSSNEPGRKNVQSNDGNRKSSDDEPFDI